MTAQTFAAKLDIKLASLMTGNAYDTDKGKTLAKSVSTRGKTLDLDIHALLVVSLDRAANHGDANFAALILNAMPNSARTATAAAWVNAFGCLTVRKVKGKGWVGNMVKAEDRLTPDMGKAKATPFWTAPEKVSDNVFHDLAAFDALNRFIKRAKGTKANLSPEVQALVATISAEVTRLAPAEAA